MRVQAAVSEPTRYALGKSEKEFLPSFIALSIKCVLRGCDLLLCCCRIPCEPVSASESHDVSIFASLL